LFADHVSLSSAEIDGLVTRASEALQRIQNELGIKNVPAARIKFPRGFIRTAATHRNSLPNLGSEVQRRNASYALMSLDVFRWLIVRTDLSDAALSMIVKEGICVFGALCEWLTKEATRGHASSRSYCQRTGKLVELGDIKGNLKIELDWIWDIRCNEHLHEVCSLEHEMYSRENYNRAQKAYFALRDALIKKHGSVATLSN
jgi:hypothetical protein